MIPLCERTVIAGKYRLERELASGGMGAVWVARHLQLDELVAVKFMSATLPQLSDARARFAREARAAARLRSPHVVQVLDHGVDDDVPYIVMELLEGEHLGDRLKRERRLHLRAASVIAAQVGKALGRAHRAGIVHRDLKPANVFLTRLDEEEIVKILDFGIAKTPRAHDEEATSLGVLMGSPQYMSPEQARGSSSLDHRADLWSLGAILFRAVTGFAAFDGASAVDVIVQICTAPVPIASRVAPDLPPRLDGFFLRALARDPARRFTSAREMTEAFSSLVRRIEAGEGAPSSAAIDSSGDDRSDGETFVMERRALDSALPLRARAMGASSAEIDAFVERAFGAIVDATGDIEPVPPTTRCPGKSSRPPPVTLERPAAAALRDAVEPKLPSPSSLVARLTRRAPPPSPPPPPPDEPHELDPESRGSVACLIEEGFTALRRGEPDSARRAWQEALGIDPSNRLLSLNLRRLDAAPAGRR